MKRGGPLKRYTQLKRGGPLKQQSKKTARRERQAGKVRRQWKKDAGCCMACGHSAEHPNPELPSWLSAVVAHEISNGPLRQRSLDKPFCVLVLCKRCNGGPFMSKREWPEARQLCLLLIRCQERYDLKAYLHHTNHRAPNRITQAEVDEYRSTIT